MLKMKLKDLISQVETSVYVDKPESEKFITVSSKGNGVRERVISEGKTPVKFNGNRVKSGLLIYSKIGASDGAFGYIPDDLNGAVVSKDFPTFEVNTDLIDKEYLLYLLLSKDFLTYAIKKSNGALLKRLKEKDLLEFDILLPNKENQIKIVSELNKIKESIMCLNLNISAYDQLVKSQFIEMFGTLDLSEERKEWIEIIDVSKIYTGTTPSTADETNWDGDILWITPAEMNSDTFFVYDTVRKISEKGKRSKSLDLMPVNTVLLSTRAPIGKVGIVGVPMTCNQGFKNFECCDKLNPIYLYTLLKNNTEYLNSLGSGTTFLEVSKSTISKLRIPLPDIKLQNKFANFIQQIDKSKFIVQKQIKLLEELLEKKMNEYFGS